MGCGKSYVGKRLAQLLKYQFLDLDDLIEKNAAQTISTIFAQQGESNFRLFESQALKSVQSLENIIVSTGGGAPCFHDNMAWMLQHGKVIFLNVDTAILVERLLPGIAHRPLLAGKSKEALYQYVEDKLQERLPIYQQAHITIPVHSNSEDVVGKIGQLLSK